MGDWILMPFSEIAKPIIVALLLIIALKHYWKYPNFRNPLLATLALVAWGGFYAPMMYLAAGIDQQFNDDVLAKADSMLGIHVPSIVAWVRDRPAMDLLFNLAYASLGLQTALVLILSSNRGVFIKRFIIGSTICLVFLCLFPAIGPFHYYGLEMNPGQEAYLEHAKMCRAAGIVLCSSGEGLITFPSFHTMWALFLMAAAKGWLKAPGVALNILVVLATLTTGWHYGVDTIIGAAIAILIILFSERLV